MVELVLHVGHLTYNPKEVRFLEEEIAGMEKSKTMTTRENYKEIQVSDTAKSRFRGASFYSRIWPTTRPGSNSLSHPLAV